MNAQDTGFALQGSLLMTVGGDAFGGASRIALLASLAETGSITQAAKAVKMSYKAAWDAIDAMNNLAGEPLVERVTGGRGGGGTRLTARGRQLVQNFRAIDTLHRDFVAQLSRQAAHIADDVTLVNRLAMKTSARNQFYGKVIALRRGAVNDEVELQIAGEHRIVAIVTHDSAEHLGLAPGRQAFALIKSSSVVLATEAGGVRFSARNQLAGTVARLTPGAVNTDVVLDLPDAGTIAAVVTNASVDALGLAPGTAALALFKASSVIVGVPD